jgi:hypothetical protein
MTLRVKVEIVPFGDEDKAYEIHRFDIFNKGAATVGGYCKYGVIEMNLEEDTGVMAIEDVLHKRDKGALELIRYILNRRLEWETLS